jgi:hypothetical protein
LLAGAKQANFFGGKMKRSWRAGIVVCAMLAALPLAAQILEPVDYDAIYRIKEEGLNVRTSQVMDTMSWLTDVHGPRLTGSPNYKAAAIWAMEKMKSWGLVNVRAEPWKVIPRPGAQGPQPAEFGRGWSNEKFYMQVTSPVPFQVIGFAKAWTPGTNGTVSGDVVLALIEREEDLAKYKGQLKGKFVITSLQRPLPESDKPLSRRYSEKELAELSTEQVPVRPQGAPAGAAQAFGALQRLQGAVQRFLAEEDVAVWIETSRAADGGTVFASAGGSRTAGPNDPPGVPRAAITLEHYGRITRLLEKKVPVTMEANIQNTFYENPELFNVVGEIPGTDKADEVVMIGAHFDSWHGGTGATDNAAGSAVMLEAVRILKASGVKMRRTVRIGLWGGEEQGLLGSRYYVREHFAEPDGDKWKVKPEHAKLAGYFNVDNGTGKIRGVYLQGNEAVAPIFRAWMEPFHNLGMTTLTPRDTGGTDHLAFDAVGLPGFQFIQDEVEYDTRTHHSNMDVYERIQETDMKQMAVIVASFVYHTANRAQLLPRKPMPAVPQAQGRPF